MFSLAEMIEGKAQATHELNRTQQDHISFDF